MDQVLAKKAGVLKFDPWRSCNQVGMAAASNPSMLEAGTVEAQDKQDSETPAIRKLCIHLRERLSQ